jgi:crotonobetainyl-CoA:carnitine CoA-transferase CaiB-like acyl-CoA transferase
MFLWIAALESKANPKRRRAAALQSSGNGAHHMSQDNRPPLAGVRVVDASRVLAGPFCGQILGDLGAEVIKIERPGTGDETRSWGPPFLSTPGLPPTSAYYLSCNRNKRGVTLDLATAEGRDLFSGLVRRSDVVLENFKADSAQKLGLDPGRLLNVNPRLIVCSISGFGRTGPLSDLPGYDFAVQALSGLMSCTGPVEGPPFKVGVAVADVLTGLCAAVAILACLRGRQQSGHGYAIDLALLDCAVAAQVNLAQAYLTGGQVPARQGNAHLQIVPYQLFSTADGWIVLAVGNDAQWRRFCERAGRPEWADDERFARNRRRVENRTVLVPLLEDLMRARTTAAWQELLRAADVPHAPLWTYAHLFAHPQAAARGLRVTVTDPHGRLVDLVGSPFHIAGVDPNQATMPPALGQDTDSVLSELLGLDAERLRDLHERGVI